MRTGQGCFEYCYNGQAVVDSAHQIIVSTDLQNTAVDIQQLIHNPDHLSDPGHDASALEC